MQILNNNLAGRYISALALKRTGKRIKLMAGGGLIIFAILFMLMPSQAHAQPSQTNRSCKPGLYTGGMGMITGVNADDDGTWSITVETRASNVFVMQYAPLNVAQRAGSLIGQTVEFHGTITNATPNCQASFLSNWDFSHNK